ncbi:rhodanese-like domain-containing protein [Geobacter sp. SVR]|uniref:rhodanese-like domain-containing protein n=1 Tax=Geobacter sp. SVR TaxID=2495594 RepID=UPI00143F04E0|nr:rhodanese-like domain-containing protein [Geobacter sp. SVR]BCS52131.1 sulfurtransferase [Geobacter sp. SVR]GCF86586.1 sulfurtransferase [Geobacter sp. SVR]
MRPLELADKIDQGQSPVVVDVRTGFEYRSGHIPGAISAPIWKILLRLAPLPRDRNVELVVLCELGPRAWMGKILLGFLGFRTITLLEGHMAGWRRAKLPLAM